MKGLFRLLESKYVSDFVFKKISGVGISYSLNLINTDVSKGFFQTAPKPGQRLPFFNYTDKGEIVSIQERIKGDRFHLFIFAGNQIGMDEQLKAAQKYSDIITTQVIPFTPATGYLYIRFGIKHSGWYLIRPDMYIACRSNESSAKQLNDYLQKLFIQHRNESFYSN